MHVSFFLLQCNKSFPFAEFVVNTPHPLAQKYWITNGAIHAKHVVVFAQLHVGGKNEGLHGILVPIRDENMKVNGVCVTFE